MAAKKAAKPLVFYKQAAEDLYAAAEARAKGKQDVLAAACRQFMQWCLTESNNETVTPSGIHKALGKDPIPKESKAEGDTAAKKKKAAKAKVYREEVRAFVESSQIHEVLMRLIAKEAFFPEIFWAAGFLDTENPELVLGEYLLDKIGVGGPWQPHVAEAVMSAYEAAVADALLAPRELTPAGLAHFTDKWSDSRGQLRIRDMNYRVEAPFLCAGRLALEAPMLLDGGKDDGIEVKIVNKINDRVFETQYLAAQTYFAEQPVATPETLLPKSLMRAGVTITPATRQVLLPDANGSYVCLTPLHSATVQAAVATASRRNRGRNSSRVLFEIGGAHPNNVSALLMALMTEHQFLNGGLLYSPVSGQEDDLGSVRGWLQTGFKFSATKGFGSKVAELSKADRQKQAFRILAQFLDKLAEAADQLGDLTEEQLCKYVTVPDKANPTEDEALAELATKPLGVELCAFYKKASLSRSSVQLIHRAAWRKLSAMAGDTSLEDIKLPSMKFFGKRLKALFALNLKRD